MNLPEGQIRIPKDVAIFLLKYDCLANAGIYVKGYGICAWEAGDEDSDGNPLPDPDEMYAEIRKEDEYKSICNDPEYSDAIEIWVR